MTAAALPAVRPSLELSGPKLAVALESLVVRSDERGGIERYVEAMARKFAAFREILGEGRADRADLAQVRRLCACMATVRRRASRYLEPEAFPRLRAHIADLLDGATRTDDADARIAAFCAVFPGDREHRFVRDLAAEILHNVDPERYPPMTRWVWDAQCNTGVLREIWHGEDVDHRTIDVPDGYDTFVVLREELAGWLTANGVYRDVTIYVDLLLAQVYATYVAEQGGSYLRADFSSHEDPMLHVQRMLGLDGIAPDGRTRLKVSDGTAFVLDERRLPG
ncbi:MAG: hypothetical protein IT518_00290 [Burkholderiales bacterium]|nr:hypothetical protein [Burkholderiales bacterium]